jgi:hypothetical protein
MQFFSLSSSWGILRQFKNLDAAVVSIGDPDAVVAVYHDTRGHPEFAIIMSGSAKIIEKLTVEIKNLDIVKHGVCHENVPIFVHSDAFGFGKIPAAPAVGTDDPHKRAGMIENLDPEIQCIGDVNKFFVRRNMGRKIELTIGGTAVSKREFQLPLPVETEYPVIGGIHTIKDPGRLTENKSCNTAFLWTRRR